MSGSVIEVLVFVGSCGPPRIIVGLLLLLSLDRFLPGLVSVTLLGMLGLRDFTPTV